jgi:hypothetical protein
MTPGADRGLPPQWCTPSTAADASGWTRHGGVGGCDQWCEINGDWRVSQMRLPVGGFRGVALYLKHVSVQGNGIAARVVAERPSRARAPRARALDRPSRVDRPRPDPLPDELADKLSNRLVERLADQLAGSVVEPAHGHRKHRDDVLPIPDGAKHATCEQLAARYQLSVRWVESRAAALGATPISDSSNSKLRYYLATADAYMDSRRRRPPTPVRGTGGRRLRPRKRTHTRTGRPLLDVE